MLEKTILDYEILDLLIEQNDFFIYQAVHIQNQNTVAIKLLKTKYPSFHDLSKIKSEYEILKQLQNVENVVHAIDLVEYENNICLVLESFSKNSLKNLIQNEKIPIRKFLDIAISLAETIGMIHHCDIIHKNICPENISYDPLKNEIKLFDFSYASKISKENPSSQILKEYTTLCYISPEQTGRMSRKIDYKTDLYSLGIILYEMVTGYPPFYSKDIMEMIHFHLAKVPPSPREMDLDIPEAISNIIMKCLSKMPEGRYNSAFGLKNDLEECRLQLIEKGKIENLRPGENDIYDRFQISPKLYGRDVDLHKVLRAFDRISYGRAELLLISGYAGVGKTSLAQLAQKLIVKQNSFFITGKFDQLKREIPYEAWLQAFNQLIHQILIKKDSEIQEIKSKIFEALQENTKVLTDLIPDLELLLGKQPPSPVLSAIESQNRLRLLLNKFIRTIGDKDHTLVIFLDDLQWADPASLQLIKSLLVDISLRHVFLIGAYRDQEVSSSHPLMQALEEIKFGKGIINEITLMPLLPNQVTQMVADTLHCSLERAQPLETLLFEKTKGNPFFLIQNLKNLYKQGEIVFDLAHSQWKWDLESIKKIAVSENVIDFMVQRIQELPPATQAILAIAAVIGTKVDIKILSKVSYISSKATLKTLLVAFDEELIKMQNGLDLYEQDLSVKSFDHDLLDLSFEFSHDRIQQAAYTILSEEDKVAIHWNIGHYLLEHNYNSDNDEEIFEIVSHLNKAISLAKTTEERSLLTSLNLRACRKAKRSAAYLTAFESINVAKSLLHANSWETEYDKTYSIYLESAECAYLVMRFDLIDELSDTILKNAKTKIEKGRLYILKIDFHTNLAQALKALEEGFECLRLFGIHLHMHPSLISILFQWLRVKWKMRNVKIADLADLPNMKDPEKQFVMDVMIHMTTAAFLLDKPLMCYITMLLMLETLKYGNCEDAFYVYLAYGTFLEIAFRDYKKAYELAMLGVKLVAKQESPSAKCRTNYVTAALINHWVNPLKTNEPYMNDCQTYGIESGELTYISFMGAFFGYLDGYYFKNVQEAFQRISYYETLIFSCQNRQAVHVFLIKKQIAKMLCKKGYDGLSLTDEEFDEDAYVHRITTEQELMPSYQSYAAYKSLVLYLFGHYEESLFLIEDSLPNREKCVTIITERDLNVYHSLSLMALYHKTSGFKRLKYKRWIKKNLKVLKIWTDCCPSSNSHRYAMVKGELARINNKFEEALTYYDEAIRLAKANDFTVEEALSNELAGRLLIQLGKPITAKAYLLEAHYCYYRWGAEAKVYQLEKEFPELQQPHKELASEQKVSQKAAKELMETNELEVSDLDIRAVMRSSTVLSGEIRLENLISQLINIIIENAGADKAIYLMEKQGKWYIQGEKYIDQERARVLQEIPLDKDMKELSSKITNYVIRTKESIVLNDAVHVGMFSQDPYIIKNKPKSVLCMPLLHQGRLTAVLYLENNSTTDAFTPQRIKILRLLSSNIASATTNAMLYSDLEIASQNQKLLNERLENYSKDLEIKVTERTQELIEKNNELAETLQSLTEMQKQVIQQEKLASLGALTKGVAHEIKNPLNFIDNFSTVSIEILDDYTNTVKHDPQEAEDLLKYLKQNLQKINEHSKRADGIVMSMLQHSKHNQGNKELVNINELLKKYLTLTLRTVQQKYPDMQLDLEANYDSTLMSINIIEQDIARCFLNILDNSCYSLNEKRAQMKDEFQPKITVTTKKVANSIKITFRDNGLGISKADLDKIFVPFFTTKPTGTGTGLGLSIAYDIIVKEHEGTFACNSEVGEYCEFIIELPIKTQAIRKNVSKL